MEGSEKQFYADKYARGSDSTRHPNTDESARASAILPLLSEVVEGTDGRPLQILDLGCGRGWLTYIGDMYGSCEGIDPAEEVIAHARRLYPNISFRVGAAPECFGNGETYDLILASEVIEHVHADGQELFVAGLRQAVASNGHVILTTPRGSLQRRYFRRFAGQPVEQWLTEEQLDRLFARHGFAVLRRARAYIPVGVTRAQRFTESRVASFLRARRQFESVLEAIRHFGSIYQVRLFKRQ